MKKQPAIYCADFETTAFEQYKKEGRTRVYLWAFSKVVKNPLDDNLIMGVDIKSFLDTLSNQVDEEKSITCYFHNLSFDGNFILYYLMENGYSYVEKVKEDKQFKTIITDMNKMYMLECMYNNRRIKFVCSLVLMSASIEKLGKITSRKKLNETHNYDEFKNYNSIEDVTAEEKAYIKNDVLIMKEALQSFFKKGIDKMTISASAYSSWLSDNFTFAKYNFAKPLNDAINELVHLSYKGGFCAINPIAVGKVYTSATSYDNNSLYPWALNHNPTPYGEPLLWSSIEESFKPKYNKYTARLYYIHVNSARIKKGYHPFISQCRGFSLIKGAYLYSAKLTNVDLAIWDIELQRFEKYYDLNYITYCVAGWKETTGVFTDFFEKWENEKMHAPDNSVDRQSAKLMLNCLGGKLGCKETRMSKQPTKIDTDGLIKYKLVETSGKYYPMYVASRMTARGRCRTVDAMQANADRWLYSDTDSIYLSGFEPAINIPIDSVKIGLWKCEGVYTKWKGLKTKCYIKEHNGKIESSIAGLPKPARNLINFDNFDFGYQSEIPKNTARRVVGGIVIIPTKFSIQLKKESV